MEKFTESFRVPSYEVKNDYSLKLSAFINHMQEISSLHASANGCGQEHIIPKGFAWMISRYHIRVEDFPKMNDRVSISTWVFGNSDPFTVREYSLKDKNGKYLIKATCSWVILNMRKKQLVPVSSVIDHPFVKERMVKDNFEKLSIPAQIDNQTDFSVRMHDLDINNHVNNKVYAEWALEAVPVEIVKAYRLRNFEIVFKNQAFYGDNVQSVCQVTSAKEKKILYHQIISKKNDEELARARTSWAIK